MKERKALILGVDTPIGLSLSRELHNYGIEVYGLGWSNKAIGSASNSLHEFFVREKLESDLISQLIFIKASCGANAVFAISENDIEILNRNRNLLRDFTLLIPEKKEMDSVLDKQNTYEVAETLGIDCPKTFKPKTVNEIESLISENDFPVVLKWGNPQSIIHKLYQNNIEFIKTEYADNMADLRGKLLRYKDLGEYPLIQNYCHGEGLGQFFLIRNGKTLQRFQHIRIHEWPPEGGTSTLCKSISLNKHSSLLNKSEALLNKLNWEGVAMVEYRYDKQSGKAHLMEINGRFWGSYPLASQAGAHFGWLLYATQYLKLNTPVNLPYDIIHCRFMIPETKRLFRVLFQSDKIKDRYYRNTPTADLLKFLLGLINPTYRNYVFSWKDCKPLFKDIKNIIWKN